MAQPEWFYSSLAQVTGAIVGFLGGFLLLRLLEVMREWQSLQERLGERQTRWSRAHSRERAYDQVHPPKLGPFTGERLKLSNDLSDAWSDLYEVIEERRRARLPADLLWSLALVTLIAFSFALGPLLALEEPSATERVLWLGTLGTALIGLATLLRAAVYNRYKALQGFKLYPRTVARLEDYELWVEGMQELEEQGRRTRRQEDDD